jgi:surface protein
MNGMFEGAESFNRPIGGWDVSNAYNMSTMFQFADKFN